MVVFFDVDGTIVDDESQIILESTAEAIRLLRENGHLPVVNTGRPYGHVDPRVQKMGFGGWICACGMELILNDKMIYQDYPTEEDCRRILESSHRHHMAIQTEGSESLLYDADMPYNPYALAEAERLGKQGVRIEAFQQAKDCNFVKFITYDTPDCDREGFIRDVADTYTATIRARTMIEFVKKGHTKAEGMERFLKELRVPREEIFAIGDSENDLPMFSMAGTTICMGNGVPKLKAAADYITDSVLEDGIFNGLRHFGLI